MPGITSTSIVVEPNCFNGLLMPKYHWLMTAVSCAPYCFQSKQFQLSQRLVLPPQRQLKTQQQQQKHTIQLNIDYFSMPLQMQDNTALHFTTPFCVKVNMQLIAPYHHSKNSFVFFFVKEIPHFHSYMGDMIDLWHRPKYSNKNLKIFIAHYSLSTVGGIAAVFQWYWWQ